MRTINKNHTFFSFKNILICILALIPLSLIILFAIWWYSAFQDAQNEKLIDKEFHEDIKQYPQVQVKTFRLWEGDSMVTLTIPKKGDVYFWYGIDKVPRITAIGKYETDFTCYNINLKGEKTSYAYNTGLVLDNSSPHFSKWFPFQIKTIGDLIHHYDDIIKILSSFPQNPSVVNFHDGNGDRSIRKTLDPDYQLKPEKHIACDLYFSQRQ